jgi:pimeloyl-ACP methyl ester carboxylesterase
VSSNRVAQARAQLEAIAAEERADPKIAHGSRWWIGDDVAPTAVVLLHGVTNSPPQYDRLAPELHARGHAVIVLRFPYHGYRDRMTEEIARMTAADFESAALRAVALGALCGRRVVVAGISVGGTLAGWLAARTRIDLAIGIAPYCGMREIPGAANDALGALLRAAPNKFLWWDPRNKAAQPPEHGYPRFATRVLGQCIGISTKMNDAPHGPHARRTVLVLNENEPAVNNAHAYRRFHALRERGVEFQHVVLPGLPPIHDIIEPEIPQAQTELVYPPLIDLIEAE